ncbi:MAG: amidase family protein, partial [Candidatus Bathyarchaeia archaeon]
MSVLRCDDEGYGCGSGVASGAAVASSACDAALVTDTLGEARVAAAEAGLIGFKPTAGIISRYGLIGLIPSMECLSVVARDIGVISRVLQAISGPDERDFSLGSRFPEFTQAPVARAIPKAVAVVPQSLAGLDSAEMKAFEAGLDVLTGLGAATREAPVEQYKLFRGVHQAVGSAEASSSGGKYDSVRYGHRAAKADDWNEMYLKSREESFGPLVKAFLFQGAYFQF